MESNLILISPFAQKLRNWMPNPKSPTPEWWKSLLGLFNEQIIQIGVTNEPQLVSDFRQNLRLDQIKQLVLSCELWISVDSFLPHLAHHVGVPGIVIWTLADPNIFGYTENVNILKDRKYLRKDQFGMWESESYNEDAFPNVTDVAQKVIELRLGKYGSRTIAQ
jgi:ADP-heptose:LPS heptosyltransferase